MRRGRISAIDTVLVGAQIINAMQSIVSRNVDPLKSAVVSICMFRAGNADNVIPQTVQLRGTARSLTPRRARSAREAVRRGGGGHGGGLRRQGQAHLQARLSGAREPRTPDGVCRRGRGQIVGKERVDTTLPPMMGAEDFSYMLKARPGAFIWVGNGDSAGLHHPAYNFNDEVIPFGTSYWVKLVETALASVDRFLLNQFAGFRRRCGARGFRDRRVPPRDRQQFGQPAPRDCARTRSR